MKKPVGASINVKAKPTRKDLLRGEFAMVEFADPDGKKEVRLVLLSKTPNLKMVFGAEGLAHLVANDYPYSRPGAVTSLLVLQHSPGMVR